MTAPVPLDRTRLGEALADELVLASQMLGDLAFDLCGDEATLRRHLTSIQKIDRITQMQLIVVDLLRADESAGDPLAAVTLEEMRDRIDQRLAR